MFASLHPFFLAKLHSSQLLSDASQLSCDWSPTSELRAMQTLDQGSQTLPHSGPKSFCKVGGQHENWLFNMDQAMCWDLWFSSSLVQGNSIEVTETASGFLRDRHWGGGLAVTQQLPPWRRQEGTCWLSGTDVWSVRQTVELHHGWLSCSPAEKFSDGGLKTAPCTSADTDLDDPRDFTWMNGSYTPAPGFSLTTSHLWLLTKTFKALSEEVFPTWANKLINSHF